MASKRIGRTAEEQALFDYQDAGQGFLEGGAAQYQNGNDYSYTKLGNVDQLGNSAYDDISTNPQYEANQLEALRQLEEQSKDGYSARDKADLARIEQSANRANQGRQGAIRQNMAARGIGGGGLEVVMAQQAAQDANEQEALASLEKNAQMQDRKQQATSQLGQLSGQLQNNQYNQQAQAAQAKDSISRFNTQNAVNTQQADNRGVNDANATNYDRRNQVADNNVNAGYTYRKDAMSVGQGNAQMANSYATEMYNRDQAKKAQKAAKKSGQGAMIGSVIGGVGGAMIGGPAGAMVGAQLGGQVGGNFAHGGRVQGPEISPFDDPANDIIPINVSPGEIVLPKSVANDPEASAQFVAKENAKQGLDPRILERLSGKNPELVNRYKSQMGEAEQGVKDADKAAGYGQYANVAGQVLNDYNNSQKSDTIYANDWMRNGGGPPKIDRADRPEYDGSGIEKLGAAGQSKAQARLEEIKAAQKAELLAQRQGDEFMLGRQDKADKDAFDQSKFEAEMGLKQAGQAQSAKQFEMSAKQSADQFGQRQALDQQQFGESVRHNQAGESIAAREAAIKATTQGANKPLSTEQQSRYDSAAMGLKALKDMGSALTSGDNTFTLPGMGDNNYTKSQAIFEEALGRMQSGGAIGKEEVDRFRQMAPTKWDSAEMQQLKLKDLEAEMGARIKSMGRDPEEAVRLRTPDGLQPQQTTSKPNWAK